MAWKGAVFMYLPGQDQAVPAAQLELFEEGNTSTTSVLTYGRRYVARLNAVPIDPVGLPLSCTPGVGYEPPAGLALFGAIRDAAPDFWGRRVIEAKLKLPPDSVPESTYLLHAGAHRFGALDFRDDIDAAEATGLLPAVMDLDHLVQAADRIQAGLPVPEHLAMLFDVPTLGGARPKALVLHEGRQFLAKFPTQKDAFDIPLVERACLELARQCGLQVPRTDLVSLADGRTVMLIERVAACTREWRTRFEALGVSPAECDRIDSAFRRPRDIGLEAVSAARAGR